MTNGKLRTCPDVSVKLLVTVLPSVSVCVCSYGTLFSVSVWTHKCQLSFSISPSTFLLAGASQIHPLPSSDPVPVIRQVSPHRPPTENPRDNCIVQTTEWSECSATCGMAISSRVTNDNQHCQLERQTRICMVRPCNSQQEREIKVCVFSSSFPSWYPDPHTKKKNWQANCCCSI